MYAKSYIDKNVIKQKHNEMVEKLNTMIVTETLLGKTGYTFIDLPALCETYMHRHNDYYCNLATTIHGYIIIRKSDSFDGYDVQTFPEKNLDKFIENLSHHLII